eukprot:gene3774-4297_t
MHYFRVPQFYWQDRLNKFRAAGLNAVQTYVAWNMHELEKGKYNFNGICDIVKFIKLAKANDLLVIIRAGPYICAEWEFGGFPAWLLKNRSVILRSSKDKNYLNAVDSWLGVLLPMLKPFLYSNGGPIISFQVENEYGSYYTCDHVYMNHLRETFIKYLGNDIVLFTTDGYSDGMMKCGGIPNLYRTVDFGAGDPTIPFKQQRKFQPSGPLVNSEYYAGWLDVWGQPHQRRDAKTIAKYLDEILAFNASVNMYMFEGGTNFGFMNGATFGKVYQPVPTSYDYDAPLNEAGDPTDKYFKIRKVISKYLPIPPGPIPKPTPKHAYGKVPIDVITSFYSMMSALFPHGTKIKSKYPQTMEEVDQSYGYLMYRTFLPLRSSEDILSIKELRDRAIVFVDKKRQGILDRNTNESISIHPGAILDILVENQGRVNYGPHLRDPKGILGNVTYAGSVLENWEMFPITWNGSQLECARLHRDDVIIKEAPMLASASFYANDNADTFLKLDGWSKGQAFINGHNLGRYWPSVGPQKTLFVPSKYLRSAPDINSLVLFELDTTSPCMQKESCYVEFVNKPNIG